MNKQKLYSEIKKLKHNNDDYIVLYRNGIEVCSIHCGYYSEYFNDLNDYVIEQTQGYNEKTKKYDKFYLIYNEEHSMRCLFDDYIVRSIQEDRDEKIIDYSYEELNMFYAEEIEIIGNIHDNPELLEEIQR